MTREFNKHSQGLTQSHLFRVIYHLGGQVSLLLCKHRRETVTDSVAADTGTDLWRHAVPVLCALGRVKAHVAFHHSGPDLATTARAAARILDAADEAVVARTERVGVERVLLWQTLDLVVLLEVAHVARRVAETVALCHTDWLFVVPVDGGGCGTGTETVVGAQECWLRCERTATLTSIAGRRATVGASGSRAATLAAAQDGRAVLSIADVAILALAHVDGLEGVRCLGDVGIGSDALCVDVIVAALG